MPRKHQPFSLKKKVKERESVLSYKRVQTKERKTIKVKDIKKRGKREKRGL